MLMMWENAFEIALRKKVKKKKKTCSVYMHVENARRNYMKVLAVTTAG